MTDRQFTIVRTFAATREQVWRAWTDPELATAWWHPHGVSTEPGSVRIDLREGGTYAYTMVADDGGDRYPTAGTYLEVRAPERLRFTWAEPGDPVDGSPIITVDLRESGDGTCEMTFHVDGIGDDRGAEDSVHQGWTEAFEVLDATLEAAR